MHGWTFDGMMQMIMTELRSRSRSRPEPAFLAGAGAEKNTKFRLRLRLLVNCKAENYEFVTTTKIIFFPDTKLQNLYDRL